MRLTDVSVMRLGPVRAAGSSRVIESLLVFAALDHNPPGFHHRAAASGLAQRANLRRSRFILLLPCALAVRTLAALRFRHEDGQLTRDDRAVSRLQVDDHAAGTHWSVLVRHPGKKTQHACVLRGFAKIRRRRELMSVYYVHDGVRIANVTLIVRDENSMSQGWTVYSLFLDLCYNRVSLSRARQELA